VTRQPGTEVWAVQSTGAALRLRVTVDEEIGRDRRARERLSDQERGQAEEDAELVNPIRRHDDSRGYTNR